MKIGYARVSDRAQCLDRQLDALAGAGADPRNIYAEKAPGAGAGRPELERMLAGLRPGDEVIVSELTRLSRSTKDLFEIAERVGAAGADIRSLKESWLDTSTPHGRLLFSVFAGLSQFERELAAERTREGLAAARARGRAGGRPSKVRAKSGAARALYEGGARVADIARDLGVSRSTVHRIVRGLRAEAGGE